jgi:putative oxidoreductase
MHICTVEVSMTIWHRILGTRAPAAIFLVRTLVGTVFLSEGIQKFLYPAALGTGRFVRIGIPWPNITAPFVGTVETAAGCLVLAGLLTRLAAACLTINISMAILSTKIPILLGYGFWGFANPKVGLHGFWAMAHEARTDWSMLLGGLCLFWIGAGPWSLDVLLLRRSPMTNRTQAPPAVLENPERS